MIKVKAGLRKFACDNWGMAKNATDAQIIAMMRAKISEKKFSLSKLSEINVDEKTASTPVLTSALPTATAATNKNTAPPVDEDKSFIKSLTSFKELSDIHVKGMEDYFDNKKSEIVVYQKSMPELGVQAGQAVNLNGNFKTQTELEKACIGTWIKYNVLRRSNRKYDETWSNLDAKLFDYMMKNMKFTGVIGAKVASEHADGSVKDIEGGLIVIDRKLNEFEVKTLINDTSPGSGGAFAVPTAFDDAIVLYPLLYGQVAPYVNMIDVRSSRIQGATMQRPTFTSGVQDGTGVAPFDTAGFIGSFDTGVFNAMGNFTIGNHLQDDSPIPLAETVTRMFGEAAQAYYDRVFAYGNGVTEAQGMLRAPGLTQVNSASGIAGPFTVNDFIALEFAVPKAFRQEAGAKLFYLGNDTSYRNVQFVQRGTDDQMRVWGTDFQSYVLNGKPYAIQENIPDGMTGYFNGMRYRAYRRQGFQIRVDNSGYNLVTRNETLISASFRLGGRLDHASAGAVMPDGHA